MFAVKCAIERPDLVSAQIIEISENQDLADEYNVGSVPHTVYGEDMESLGLESEERFAVQLLMLRSADEIVEEMRRKEQKNGKAAPAAGSEEVGVLDVLILGAGPAGLTAAIYGQRSGLECLVLDSGNVGGQVAVTPVVEKLPRFFVHPRCQTCGSAHAACPRVYHHPGIRACRGDQGG